MSNCIQLKTSVIKGIKNQLLEQFPDIESWLNHIMPKKDPVKIVRWYDLSFHVSQQGSLMQSVFSIVAFLLQFLYVYCSSHSHEHIEILTVNGELLFFRQREGPFYPTLRLLHKCKISHCQLLDDAFRFPHTDKKFPFLLNRSFHSSTPASRQRGHKICPQRSKHHVSRADVTRR